MNDNKTRTLHAAFLIRIIESLTAHLSDLIENIMRTVNKPSKNNDIPSDIKDLPYCDNNYVNELNKYVMIGRSSPKEAIEAALGLFPYNNSSSDALVLFLNKIGVAMNESSFPSDMGKALAFCFMSDICVQLFSYVETAIFVEEIQNMLRILSNLSFNHKDLKGKIHSQMFYSGIEQFSVILGFLSKNVEIDLLSSANHTKVSLLLSQYIRHKPSNVENVINQYLSLLKSFKKDNEIKSVLIRSILNLVLQINDASIYEGIRRLKEEIMKASEFPNESREILTVIDAKTPGITMEKVLKSCETIMNDSKMSTSSKFKCILYYLRGGSFDISTTFWKFGEYNGQAEIGFEYSCIWNPKDSCSEILDLITRYIPKMVPDSTSNDIFCSILLNLGARDIKSFISIISAFIGDTKNHILPVVTALSKIVDPSQLFCEIMSKQSHIQRSDLTPDQIIKNLNDQIHTSLTIIKGYLFKRLSQSIPTESNFAIYPHSLSIYECPTELNPNFIPPNGESFTTIFSSLSSNDFKVNSQLPLNANKVNYSIPLKEEISGRPSNDDKVVIQLICLINLILVESDFKHPTDNIIESLVKSSLSTSLHISHFALYALQYMFITHATSRESIYNTVISFLMIPSPNPNRFTLLSLLYQLLSLPYLPIRNESNSEWFDHWVKQIQALIVIQFCIPYSEARFIIIKIIARFQEVCLQNDIQSTIFFEEHVNEDKVLRRVQKICSLSNTSYVSFPNICCSSYIEVYAVFFEEFLLLVHQNKFRGVVRLIEQSVLTKPLLIPTNLSNDQPLLIHFLLYSVLYLSSHHILTSSMSRVNQNIHRINELAYVKHYDFLDPILNDNDANNNASGSSNLFMLLITEYLQDKAWSILFMSVILKTIPPSFLSSIMQILIGSISSPSISVPSNFVLYNATKIIFKICTNPDFDITYHASRASFNSLKSFLSFFVDKYTASDLESESGLDALRSFLKIISIVTNVCKPFYMPGSHLSLQRPSKPDSNESWSSDERERIMRFINDIAQTKAKLKTSPQDSDLLIESDRCIMDLFCVRNFFGDSSYSEFKSSKLYNSSIMGESVGINVLAPVLSNHPKFFEDYFVEALSKEYRSNFFFRAIAHQFCMEDTHIDLNSEIPVDDLSNRSAFKHRGKLFVLSLVYLTSTDHVNRKLAFVLLKRLVPIISAIGQPQDLEPVAIVNSFLKTNKSKFMSKTSICDPISLTELELILLDNFGLLIDPISDTALEYLEQLANEMDYRFASTLLLILQNSSSRINLEYRGISFLHKLVSLCGKYSSIPTESVASVFVSLCSRFEGNRNIISKIIGKVFCNNENNHRKPQTEIILTFLVRKYPFDFLPDVARLLTFSHWYFVNVCNRQNVTKTALEIIDHTKLSLVVLEELASSDFSVILSVLHYILHYCLIYINQFEFAYQKEAIGLLKSVCKSLGVGVEISNNPLFSFQTNGPNSSLSVNAIVTSIVSCLAKLYPSCNSLWHKEALKWTISCGDLELASKSAFILTCFVNESDCSGIPYILNALAIYADFKADKKTLGKAFPSYLEYLVHCLKYILNRIIYMNSISGSLSSSVFYIARFVIPFIFKWRNYTDVVDAVFQILCVFSKQKAMLRALQFDEHLSGLSRFLGTGHPPVSAYRFFSTLAFSYSTDMSQSKVFLFSILMPLIYGSFCAYHCIDPYSSSISDDSISEVLFICSQVCTHEFGANSSFSLVFSHYFTDPDNSSPEEFLIEIAKCLVQNNLSIILSCGPIWGKMCQFENYVVKNAIFTLCQAIISQANEKASIIDSFATIIEKALETDSPHSFNFLYLISQQSLPVIPFDVKKAPDSTSKGDSYDTEKFREEIMNVISTIPHQVSFVGDVDLINSVGLPLLPTIKNADIEAIISKLTKIVPQPYINDKNEILRICTIEKQKVQDYPQTVTLEKLYVHTEMELPPKEEPSFLLDGMAPEYFVIHEGDIDQYFNRITEP